MTIDEVSGAIVDAAMKVHTVLGPGLLESAYAKCLVHELRSRGLRVLTELELPIKYEGLELDAGYRLDLLVGDCVIVEVKAVESLNRIHQA